MSTLNMLGIGENDEPVFQCSFVTELWQESNEQYFLCTSKSKILRHDRKQMLYYKRSVKNLGGKPNKWDDV